MKKLNLLYEGKAKQVFVTEDKEKYIIAYKDDATAFNGVKKGTLVGKGQINNKMSALLFKLLEEQGIPTHFEALLSETESLVKAVEILPIEVIVRNTAAGSLAKRLGLDEGTELSTTVIEYCYKNDELGDPMINGYHIKAMQLATEEQMTKIEAYALKINEILKEIFNNKNMKLIDFKLEFGTYKDTVILADEISPDTCRLWDTATHEKLDKDRFRRDLGDVMEAYIEVFNRLQETRV